MWRLTSLMLSALILSAGVASAQECLHTDTEQTEQLERRRAAVQALRVLNTVEMIYRSQTESFGTFANLVASSAWDGQPGTGRFSTESGTDLIPGFRLQLTTDGQSFAMSLRDTMDPCGFTAYTNSEGIIYTGYPINYTVVPLEAVSPAD